MHHHLLNKYGVRLTLDEVSEILKIPTGTLYNKRSDGSLPFNSYRDGLRVFVDTKVLADYLESKNGANL